MAKRILHKTYVKVLTWLRLAIDISSREYGPEAILSNFTDNHFVFDGVECGGMEGFLLSLKHEPIEKQQKVCALYGVKTKRKGTWKWQEKQIVYWKGRSIARKSCEFQNLVRDAFRVMFEQCTKFREALLATENKLLFHSMGKTKPQETILTEKEFCDILTELRLQL